VAGVGSVGPASSAVAAETDDGRVYYARAHRLAGSDPVLRALVTALTPRRDFPRPPAPAPIKLFDNLAMLSTGWVSAMAVLTGDGIVLIDALTSAAEAENVLVPGLRELGADPETIRYVVVTHGHDDHFGGARYLADRYGARVLMSPADWDLVAGNRPADAPARDLEIADGHRLTLGGTTIQLHHTPGHTPGPVSPIIPVRTGSEGHNAMLWGGTDPPTTPTAPTWRPSPPSGHGCGIRTWTWSCPTTRATTASSVPSSSAAGPTCRIPLYWAARGRSGT
jgi:metallo-beta-lactamase class B